MAPGDLVRYWFARKFPVTGVVLRRWDWGADVRALPEGTYLYSVELLEYDGTVGVFDIHVGDQWEVLCEGG